MKLTRLLSVSLLQGFLLGGCVHLLFLFSALGRAIAGRETQGDVVQDLQEKLTPWLFGYLLALLALLVIRVLIHAVVGESTYPVKRQGYTASPLPAPSPRYRWYSWLVVRQC